MIFKFIEVEFKKLFIDYFKIEDILLGKLLNDFRRKGFFIFFFGSLLCDVFYDGRIEFIK